MGYVSAEQTTAIIDSVGNAIAHSQPKPEPTNYWWLLSLAIIPVVLGWWLNRRKRG